jgi:acyl-CoA thioesterase FadM
MVRAIEWEHTVDTSTFSAVQLQPGVIASLTWNALSRWMRTYVVDFPRLIGREATGMVVMGFHLEYKDPVTFFECPAFRVRAAFRIMRRGERGELNLHFFAQNQELAVARLIVRPVAILDPVSLGAEPAPLPESLLAYFEADEIQSASPQRIVPSRLATVETMGALLAEATTPFRIHRHLSEVAEQWAWTETPALVESARENMALNDRSEHKMQLRRCLRHRLARFDVEYSRPYFSFEKGEIVSRAYDVAGHLAFAHRFTSQRGAHLHATVVEVFEAGESRRHSPSTQATETSAPARQQSRMKNS